MDDVRHASVEHRLVRGLVPLEEEEGAAAYLRQRLLALLAAVLTLRWTQSRCAYPTAPRNSRLGGT